MPRISLLVADDGGLDRRGEAVLMVLELLVRNHTRAVFIVCPAVLQIHWRDQMWDKFGLDFHVVDSALMKDLCRSRSIYVNHWSHFPRLITSIDFIKQEWPMCLLHDVLPAETTYPRK
ncbi:MAG: hypothetical protein KF770_18100 [Anaerolineae bacterium]|nr:hypothetical protein [Anaerolineae bacterium]